VQERENAATPSNNYEVHRVSLTTSIIACVVAVSRARAEEHVPEPSRNPAEDLWGARKLSRGIR